MRAKKQKIEKNQKKNNVIYKKIKKMSKKNLKEIFLKEYWEILVKNREYIVLNQSLLIDKKKYNEITIFKKYAYINYYIESDIYGQMISNKNFRKNLDVVEMFAKIVNSGWCHKFVDFFCDYKMTILIKKMKKNKMFAFLHIDDYDNILYKKICEYYWKGTTGDNTLDAIITEVL